jgi:hypothetical protein
MQPKNEDAQNSKKIGKATFLNGDMPESPYIIQIKPKPKRKQRRFRSLTNRTS